jgi:hypothetical protein
MEDMIVAVGTGAAAAAGVVTGVEAGAGGCGWVEPIGLSWKLASRCGPEGEDRVMATDLV